MHLVRTTAFVLLFSITIILMGCSSTATTKNPTIYTSWGSGDNIGWVIGKPSVDDK